ncbi:MAG: tetratricopeptide repeat protein, partial [Candidatus Omnitrophica bacterium]|nr:tetratricopeptide repeat protein [Candidatus Omnitrophota bacterium]
LYLDLVKRFPDSPFIDEANFKVAIIYAYMSRDIKSARGYFEELAKKEIASPQVISSLYQLGLLSQWENDLAKAKDYYNRLIEKAGSGFADSVTLAKERLREIEGSFPIEYNLKTFLDVSLKEEYAINDMTKLDLRAHPYKADKGQEINITSTAYIGSSGCMQVQLQYLWSGDIGKARPTLDQTSFNTSYESGGTKEINLVVVSPSGIIDRNLDLVDIN